MPKKREALIDKIEIKNHTQWINEFNALKEKEYEVVIRSEINVKRGFENGRSNHLLSKKTNGNAIIVTDVGQHQMVTSDILNTTNGMEILRLGGLGTMGFYIACCHRRENC